MEPHKRSRSDRMQRDQMEQEINDCNMITDNDDDKDGGLKTRASAGGSCGVSNVLVEEMETWL